MGKGKMETRLKCREKHPRNGSITVSLILKKTVLFKHRKSLDAKFTHKILKSLNFVVNISQPSTSVQSNAEPTNYG